MRRVPSRRQVKSILRLAGVRPSRGRGQHFLVDPRGPLLFIKGLSMLGADEALEVGAGLGSITLEASRRLRRVVAVEVDWRLASYLASRAPPNVAVVVGDGVEMARSWAGRVVYSNTPFSLTGEIVEAVARNNRVAGAVLGVQREVAERMKARPGEDGYGRLSVLVSLIFRARSLGVIPPSWYYPRPEVWTSVLVLERTSRWNTLVEAALKLAGCMFTMRRRRAEKVAAECFRRLGCRGAPPRMGGGVRVWSLEPRVFVELAGLCGG